MMERRRTPRREWVVGQDDTGRAVLEWKLDSGGPRGTDEIEPAARTYDFLKRLEIPGLELEEEARRGSYARGCNPYDHMPAVRGTARRLQD